MATSSIFSTVKITTQKQAEDFVAILERSEKDSAAKNVSSSVNIHPSQSFLKDLLQKRFSTK